METSATYGYIMILFKVDLATGMLINVYNFPDLPIHFARPGNVPTTVLLHKKEKAIVSVSLLTII